MKLGLGIGYSGSKLRIPIERIRLAEHLGYDSVWIAEAYGSDAITPLAWIEAHTAWSPPALKPASAGSTTRLRSPLISIASRS